MNRQGYRLFITLSVTKNRRDVFKTGRCNNFLYHRFTFRILPQESRAKSAFVVPMGKWQFKCTLFGLSQAPAYFQLLIDKVLMGCSSFAMGYLDNIIIFSKTEEEHLQHLEEIFVRLRKFGLKMKHEKCSFFKKHIQYLGHLVSEKGFELLPEKLDASGIGWSGMLTQEHLDEKGKVKNHPICYVSGQFRGSQLNWAALTKEAYVIYMSVRRLRFYITDTEVTIRNDHLPLKSS